MPDQPDDPIHYDMKIPPEPQNATLQRDEEKQDNEQHRGSDEATDASNKLTEKRSDDAGHPPQPSGGRK